MRARSAKCALIAAGGSGGHVIPALEVAKELRSRDWECIFLGTSRGFENRLVPAAGFALHHVPIGSLNRQSARHRLATLLAAPRAVLAAMGIAARHRPAAALSLGGYVAGPLVVACALFDVPLVVLEPNATPGMANRLAAPAARRSLVGHPLAASYFRSASCRLTGMPVRGEFFRVPPRRAGAPFTVLVLGGSQGAASLNKAAVEAARIWARKGGMPARLVHQTGKWELEKVEAAYRDLGVEAETAAFFDDMPRCFAACDLVICRAGASVLAELCASRKPAVLVPFPYAADDHQRANGAVLAAAGGATVVEDADWTGERMASEVDALRQEPERLEKMRAALVPLSPAGAAQRAANAIEEAAAGSGGLI